MTSIHSFNSQKSILSSHSLVALLLAMLVGSALFLSVPALAASAPSTTTTLAVSAASVAIGTPVTLTATVTSGGNPLTTGQVVFCNSGAAHCEDSAILGTVFLTSNGTATLRRTLPAGTTHVTAELQGMALYAKSSSGVQTVTVTGQPGANAADTFPAGGTNATATIAGDFNNDGIQDLAVVDQTAATVQVFLGKGDGTFNTGATLSFLHPKLPPPLPQDPPLPLTCFPSAIATADVNGDGNADLIVGGQCGGSVGGYTILLGDGEGGFAGSGNFAGVKGANSGVTTAASFESCGSVKQIKVADFNADGHADVAIYGVYSNSAAGTGIEVLLGAGDGTFTISAISESGIDGDFAIGDFNGDGIPDIVATSTAAGAFDILLGNGDGTFSLAPGGHYYSQSYNWISSPRGVAVGDFNGDGNADIAVSESGNHTVSILNGNGDGTFTVGAATVNDGSGPNAKAWSVAAADFNGDGHTDLALVINWLALGDPNLSILNGNGDGTFGAPQTFALGTPVNSTLTTPNAELGIGDFYGNGIPAVALLTDGSASDVTILQQKNGVPTTPAIAANLSASYVTYGNPVTVSVQVSCGSSCGNVQFTLDGNAWATPALNPDGTATVSTADNLSVGTHSVVVDYQGDSNYSAVNSSALTLTVAQATPIITWAAPAAITVGTPLSTTQLDATANVAGTPVYTPALGTSFATPGNQTLSMTFTPDDTTDYQTVTRTVPLTVTAVPAASYTLSASTNTITGSSSVTLSLLSTNYAGTVSFVTSVSSSNGTASAVTVGWNPSNQVSLTNGGNGSTVITITAAANAANHAPVAPWKTGGLIAFGAVLLGAPLALRRKRVWIVLLTALVISLLGFSMACSSSGYYGGVKVPGTTTAARTYTVLVTPIGTGTVTNPSPITITMTIQ